MYTKTHEIFNKRIKGKRFCLKSKRFTVTVRMNKHGYEHERFIINCTLHTKREKRKCAGGPSFVFTKC